LGHRVYVHCALDAFVKDFDSESLINRVHIHLQKLSSFL